MAIWSLTKERVERLQKQIGEKEVEIDTLIKLSKEDLWKRDLDDFINEWRFQLADEEKRQKKVANLGRRASVKVRTQIKPTARKRKANNDSPSDSDVSFEKPKKAAVTKRAQQKTGLLSNLTGPTKPKQQTSILSSLTNAAKPVMTVPQKVAESVADASEDVRMTLDGAADHDSDAPVAPKRKAKPAPAAKKAAPVKVSKVISDDSDEEEVIRPAAATSRTARTATRKPVKYTALDSDSEDGDDMLFDVGKMVKGIGVNGASAVAAASRPLFSASASMSRPSSSAGLVGRKPASKSNSIEDDNDDETDYTRLAPANAKTAKSTVLSDDGDDSFDLIGTAAAASVPVAPVSKPKASVKPAPAKPAVSKKAAAPVAKSAPKEQPRKVSGLSPAAKAYAAKQARGTTAKSSKSKTIVDIDSDDDASEGDEVGKMVDDMLSEDEDDDDIVVSGARVGGGAGAGRPARRAAAQAAVKKRYVLDDEDEDEEESDKEEEEEASFASEGSE